MLKKLFQPKKTKLFWLYIVVGILLAVVGAMLMPIWNSFDWAFWKTWGMDIINIVICACLVVYIFGFLVKKIAKSRGVVQVLTIVEFVLLALIAVGCVLQQFKVINVGGSCAILGLALWCRGVVEIFRAYYHQKGNNDRYPVWWLVIAIFLVSFGVYLYVRPLFQDITVLWIFVILIFLVAFILIVDGFIAKPKKSVKTKEVETKKKNKK